MTPETWLMVKTWDSLAPDKYFYDQLSSRFMLAHQFETLSNDNRDSHKKYPKSCLSVEDLTNMSLENDFLASSLFAYL